MLWLEEIVNMLGGGEGNYLYRTLVSVYSGINFKSVPWEKIGAQRSLLLLRPGGYRLKD